MGESKCWQSGHIRHFSLTSISKLLANAHIAVSGLSMLILGKTAVFLLRSGLRNVIV